MHKELLNFAAKVGDAKFLKWENIQVKRFTLIMVGEGGISTILRTMITYKSLYTFCFNSCFLF